MNVTPSALLAKPSRDIRAVLRAGQHHEAVAVLDHRGIEHASGLKSVALRRGALGRLSFRRSKAPSLGCRRVERPATRRAPPAARNTARNHRAVTHRPRSIGEGGARADSLIARRCCCWPCRSRWFLAAAADAPVAGPALPDGHRSPPGLELGRDGQLVAMTLSVAFFMAVAAVTAILVADAFTYALIGLLGGCGLGSSGYGSAAGSPHTGRSTTHPTGGWCSSSP